MRFLLDTCFFSDLEKAIAPPPVVSWAAEHDIRECALSVITIGEVRRGIELLPPSRRRGQFMDWLSQDLLKRFEDRILEVDTSVAEVWGVLSARARAAKRSLSTADGLLLATAGVHHLAVVTRNVRHFSGYDVHVINPWEATEVKDRGMPLLHS